MRYESSRDVELRLRHSVVMCNERPVMVMDVQSVSRVMVQDILSGNHFETDVDKLDLQPSHAPLGYVMAGDDVYMAYRKPVRKYKQGLTNDNLLVKGVLQKRPEMLRRRPINFASRELAKTMVGDFPDIGKAFKLVREGENKIVPFSRDWAVAEEDGDLCIVFRGEVVGYATDNSVKLLPERFYLKESLELCLK